MFLKKGFFIIVLVASATLLIKLALSYFTYGTNDITGWIYEYIVMQRFGILKIYSIAGLNHPPLIAWIIKLVGIIGTHTNLSFPYLFRLLPIFADYASVFVIWGLLALYNVKNKLFILLLCSINPVNFFVSGFHGTLDSVMVFFILLAVYFLKKENIILSGLIYGLSISTKVIPIILAPIFLFYIKGKDKKAMFTLCFLSAVLAIALPHLIHESCPAIRNIFLYGSDRGIWGIWRVFGSRCNIANYREIFLIILIILPQILIRTTRINLLEAIFLAFCLFLILTPGFGVQYLSWLSFFSIIVLPVLGTVYLLVGAFFLYKVYAYWGGATPPYYYANSWTAGPWAGFAKTLDIVLWLIIIMMLIEFLSLNIKTIKSKGGGMMEMEKKPKVSVRPIYKILLIAALAVYVISSCIMQADLCCRVGKIEHELLHISGGHH